MPNSFWNDTADIIDGTKSSAGTINQKYDGIEAGFDAVEAQFAVTIQLPAGFSGNGQVPAGTLTDRLIYFNSSGNIDLFPLTTITTAEANAAASAANAAASEAAAGTSETNAAGSASAAIGSASAAATSESNAATSAGNAATSESNASTSASNAATSEGNAATSASNASTSEGNAATSASNASTSEGNAATSASNAATSESNAGTSASNAATAAANAEAAWDAFDDTYLGAFASPPTLDNDGQTIQEGALYWNTTNTTLYVRDSGAWVAAANASGGSTDADTFDGYDSTEFPRKAEAATITASWNLANGSRIGGVTFTGTTASYTGTLALAAVSATSLTVNGGTVWHSGNDGAGSGLDADTLDGVQGSSYALASQLSSYLPASEAGIDGGNITTDQHYGMVNYNYNQGGGTPTRGDCGVHVYQNWSNNLLLSLTDSSWQRGDIVRFSNPRGTVDITVNATRIYLPNGSFDTQVTFNQQEGGFALAKYDNTTGYWMVLP